MLVQRLWVLYGSGLVPGEVSRLRCISPSVSRSECVSQGVGCGPQVLAKLLTIHPFILAVKHIVIRSKRKRTYDVLPAVKCINQCINQQTWSVHKSADMDIIVMMCINQQTITLQIILTYTTWVRPLMKNSREQYCHDPTCFSRRLCYYYHNHNLIIIRIRRGNYHIGLRNGISFIISTLLGQPLAVAFFGVVVFLPVRAFWLVFLSTGAFLVLWCFCLRGLETPQQMMAGMLALH